MITRTLNLFVDVCKISVSTCLRSFKMLIVFHYSLSDFEFEKSNKFSTQSLRSKENLSIPLNEKASDMNSYVEPETEILSQLTLPPVSSDQLIVEAKTICVSLNEFEAKCIAMHQPYLIAIQEGNRSRFKNSRSEEWQNLALYHRTLIDKHYDLHLACQHPSTCSQLKEFIADYTMPLRMWTHGISTFLKILGNWLPETLDHMLAFMYNAYTMLTLFSEMTSGHDWSECLGHLAVFLAGNEKQHFEDHNIWNSVATSWYQEPLIKVQT